MYSLRVLYSKIYGYDKSTSNNLRKNTFSVKSITFFPSKSVKIQLQGFFTLRYGKLKIKTHNIQNIFINRYTQNSIIETFSVTTFALFIALLYATTIVKSLRFFCDFLLQRTSTLRSWGMWLQFSVSKLGWSKFWSRNPMSDFISFTRRPQIQNVWILASSLVDWPWDKFWLQNFW